MKYAGWICIPGCGPRKSSHYLNETGWVLLENIVSIPIFMLVTFTACLMLLTLYSSFDRLSFKAEQQFYVRIATDEMIEDIKQSGSIEVLNEGAVLRLIDENGNYLTYYLNQQQLTRFSNGSGIPLTENTIAVQFAKLSADSVEITLHNNKRGVSYSLNTICSRVY